MDELDRQIVHLLTKNARMPVKEIAEHVNLTSPAISSRIRRLETDGIIAGYTVICHNPGETTRVQALISVSVNADSREEFLALAEQEPQVLQCWRVTGSYNFIVKVSCESIDDLEHLLTRIQKLGSTNTQIILNTTLDRPLAP